MSIKTITFPKYQEYLSKPTIYYPGPNANFVIPASAVVSGAYVVVNITADRTCTFPDLDDIKTEWYNQTGTVLNEGEIIPKDFIISSVGAFDLTLIAGNDSNIVGIPEIQNENVKVNFSLVVGDTLEISYFE